MKKLFLLAVLIMLSKLMFGQQLKVEERKSKNEESIELLSWTAVVDQDVDYSKDSFEDFMKDLFKKKVIKRSKNILAAEGVLIPELSSTIRMDLRANFGAETSGTAISFTFSPGYDVHFSHDLYAAEFAKSEDFTKGFVRYHYNRFYNSKLKDLKSKLKSMQDDAASNSKKEDNNNKAIYNNTKSTQDPDKIKLKNDKLQKDNDSLANETNKLKDAITAIEDQISKINESLAQVDKFK